MRLATTLYRALNPYWAYRPLSGEGASRLGGRFNARGRPALYLATSVAGAILETNQAGTLMPTTLVAVQADLPPVFDATDAAALAAHGVTPATLALPDWAVVMGREGRAPTQDFAEAVIAAGHPAMIVPSYAPGAGPEARNVVVWTWSDAAPTLLRVLDPAARLSWPPAEPKG